MSENLGYDWVNVCSDQHMVTAFKYCFFFPFSSPNCITSAPPAPPISSYHLHRSGRMICENIKSNFVPNVFIATHLSLVLLSNVSLSSTNPGPKKGTDNFLIGEQTSNLDQGMGVFVCGLQPTRIAL